MSTGYMGQILEVDLCEKKFQIQNFPYDDARNSSVIFSLLS